MLGLTRNDTVSPYVMTANPAPAVLERALTAQLGAGITVSNEGVGGAQASDLLNGTDGKHLPWVQTLANTTANIVVVNFALNDAVKSTPTAYKATMTEMVADARSAGKTIVFDEPNPVCNAYAATVDNFVIAMRQVAQENNVPLIPQYDVIRQSQGWQASFPDCVHPNDAMYQEKGQRMTTALAQIVSAFR